MKTEDLLSEIKQSPDQLSEIPPHEFEALVAELLAGFGWEVNLTPSTHDGGYDILGIMKDASGLESTWVVECKKYHPGRKVGVEVARSLLGVKTGLGASNGLLVTTSTFTQGARQVAKENDIHLVDRDRLLAWIESYSPSPEQTPYIEQRSFHSCFISYSHKDEEFAKKLNTKLREEGIRVWFAPEDILPGRKIHDEVSQAISSFDKLLLVLSESSMNSEWVKTEIRKARRREVEEGRQVLFPVALVPIARIREWECFDSDIGKDLAVEIREYLIPDLSRWRDADVFDEQVTKIIEGLRAAGPRSAAPQEETEDDWIESLADNHELYAGLQSVVTVRDTCSDSVGLDGMPDYSPSLRTHDLFESGIKKISAGMGQPLPFDPILPSSFSAGYKLCTRVLRFVRRNTGGTRRGLVT